MADEKNEKSIPDRESMLSEIKEKITPHRKFREEQLHSYIWDKIYSLWFEPYFERCLWIMIGDVLDFIDKERFYVNLGSDIKWRDVRSIILDRICIERDYKNKAIQDQDDECIRYIHSLVSENNF